jgi:hypothetical protein
MKLLVSNYESTTKFWSMSTFLCFQLLNFVVKYWISWGHWMLIWDSTSWCSHSLGISHSAKGYCLKSVLETMKTYSAEEGLTEEAIVTKLRICRYHHLYLHNSLKNNSSGWDLYSWVNFLSICLIYKQVFCKTAALTRIVFFT